MVNITREPNTIVSFLECPPLTLTNGIVNGNVNYFGSRISYECDFGYSEENGETVSTCWPDGKWSYTPSCYKIGLSLL